MAGSVLGQGVERRQAALREVLDAAWALMEREGVAALSMRELSRSLGIRPQSVAHYFPTKPALLDALFRDGFIDLAGRLHEAAGRGAVPADALVGAVSTVLAFSASSPARYHLMLQRTVPGFTPTPESQRVALDTLALLLDRLTGAGISDPADVDVFRGLVNGLAAEQIANDPGGRRFIGRAEHAVRLFLAGVAARSDDEKPKGKRKQALMNVTGLHHVLLTVGDLERSTAFYTGVLGLRIVREVPDDGQAGAKVLCALPDGRLLGLVQHRANPGDAFDEFHTGLDHVALTVPAGDLPDWSRRLDEAGVEHSPPAPSAFGDPLIVFRDPDRIQLQIYGIETEAEAGDSPPLGDASREVSGGA
jgi:catechol 2,3-dioxygenase-like lactoylglutathione lyase family enzyme/AcrR family transcriptional regulator